MTLWIPINLEPFVVFDVLIFREFGSIVMVISTRSQNTRKALKVQDKQKITGH